MANYTYDRTIPASNNDPTQDQPGMLTNTQSIEDLIGEDHITFNLNDGGKHKYCTFPNRDGSSLPYPTTLENEGALYVANDGAGVSQLFFKGESPSTTASSYQLTSSVANTDPNIGTFGSLPSGWSFLPGGLLIQYGYFTSAVGNTGTVNFPKSFKTATLPVVNLSLESIGTTTINLRSSVPPTNVSFDWVKSGTAARVIHWIAIGQA